MVGFLRDVFPFISHDRPQFSLFELEEEDIKVCLDLAGRAIVISGWLAAVARRELARFKEFISFIRYGTFWPLSAPC